MNEVLKSVLLSLFAVSLSHAEPSSQVAWTPDKLNFIKKANSKNGKELAMQCAGCHGDKGISPAQEFPSLAGQLATYTYKQLQDYKNGQRIHAVMTSIAAGLSEQEMADLSVWYSSLPRPKNKPGKKIWKLPSGWFSRVTASGLCRRVLPVMAQTEKAKEWIYRPWQGNKLNILRQRSWLIESRNATTTYTAVCG